MADQKTGVTQSADAKLSSDVANLSLKDPKATSEVADDMAEGNEEEGDEEDEPATAGAEGSTKAKKKRKPKKKKAAGSSSEEGAQSQVQQALADSGATKNPVSSQDIQSLLAQLGVENAGKKEGKSPEEYKFWNTQPVPKMKEPNLLQTTEGADGESLPEGAILPDHVCKAAAKPEPEKLVEGFEWDLVDIDNKDELQELWDLLYNHYVEDTEGSFRFNYSKKFLAWALKPPGWTKEWHIGVRTKSKDDGKKGKLVAFISAIPVELKVRGATLKASEVNFLTIHRKLRSKRLAPVLIKEVTRKCFRNGIYQALYTAGTLLPTPVATCKYFHRSLDWEHLYATGFSHLPPGSNPTRQRIKYNLPSKTSLKGLRPMREADIPQVQKLLTRYVERFSMRQGFSEEELKHLLCSQAAEDVVWAFVVEDAKGQITDFISYYLLESTVLKSQKVETIRAAYLYYYASSAAFDPATTKDPTSTTSPLALRLRELVHDVLVLAKKDNFHVFNALTLLDNPLFLKDQKFEMGDGKLRFYLYNWRTGPMASGVGKAGEASPKDMGGVGVVML
ncbi:hypothetical protein MBLNU230_g2359t1 [Neophaeotheca triangularis]